MKGGMDLHLHLDGSLSAEFILEQGRKQNVALPAKDVDSLKPYLSVSADCKDLNEYLEKFDLPGSVLQNKEGITEAVKDLCERLHAQGLVYAEIRFAPQLHTKKGLNQEEIVQAAIDGLRYNMKLILCCMRMENNEKENMETIRLTKKYLGKGVVASDLAGAEALYPTVCFEKVFEYATSLEVPFTIHAGEAAGPESIWKALELGAKRIGHGVRCLEDEKLVQYLKEHRIPLEVCLTSNIQTRAVDGIHPIKRLLEEGLCVTLNTDNMTVSDTTLKQEFALAREKYGISEEEINELMENAKYARF